ncbi:MAG: SpoIIE family protein phosphatase [Anaerolineales bacterium]|nr:SpoIIE family protein phosphatase [Anaerolineales bacterium]
MRDRLHLFTDGLCDVLNSAGDLFGRPRLKSLIKSSKGFEIKEMCDHVINELTKYRGNVEQFDDMALLILDVL